MVAEGMAPLPVRKLLDGARGFAKTGHGFPLSFYGSSDTVFWPGCGLAGSRPGLVRRLRNILGRRLHKRVGLVLDCCFDPVYELGDTETASVALKEIHKRLQEHGVRQVITGCLNCHKLLAQQLDDIQVVFILEVLPPELFEKRWAGPAYLHHPCPSSRWEVIRDCAGAIMTGTDLKSVPKAAKSAPAGAPAPEKSSPPQCCGSGGGLGALSPELADRFLDRIIATGGRRTIVTYCIGCQDRFLKKGVEAVHILECLPGMTPRLKIASTAKQWSGRLGLATMERLKTGRFAAVLIIFLLIIGGLYLNQENVFSAERLVDLLHRFPVMAPLIFLGIYALAPSLFLPSIPLTLAAGFFWGPVLGVIFSISGATLGACLPFFLARYLFQETIRAKAPAERWKWLQDRVIEHGWKAVAFTRLVPVFPFNLLNYLFGLTPIPFRQYLLSTFVFMLPACIAFVAFGSSLGELIMRGNIRGVVIGVVTAVIAFLVPVSLRPFFRKIGNDNNDYLNKKMGKEENT